MKKIIKKTIKKIFNYLGFNISKITVDSTPPYQIFRALKSHDINLVFDIGANTGQFVSDLRLYGYIDRVVSFEPLSDAYEKLTKISRNDRNWLIHPRCALGNNNGYVEINLSKNSVSSSILPMLSRHRKAAPQSYYVQKESVPIFTLDEICNQYLKPDDSVFIKIDTQGYESEVLKGAKEILSKCKGIMLELSIVHLYENQKLWQEIIDFLSDYQFELYGVIPGFTDPENGQTLQFDGIFFKKVKI